MRIPDLPDRRYEVYRTIDMAILPVIVEMESAGVLINQTRVRALSDAMTVKHGELLERLTTIGQLAGIERFNVNSPIHVQTLLYDVLKLPPGKRKKGEERSTAREYLERMRSNRIVADLIEFRGLSKLKSTYTDKLDLRTPVCVVNPQDGHVYAHFNTTSVKTRRSSSSNPINLQNIPKRVKPGTPDYVVKWIKEIRKCFVPALGLTWFRFDQSQVEWRVLVNLAKCDVSIREMLEGRDPHLSSAAVCLGLPYDEALRRRKAGDKTVEAMRDLNKNVNYGIAYGSTPENTYAYAQGVGINIDMAGIERIHETVLNSRPAIAEYIARSKWEAVQRGYVETYYGGRIFYPELQADEKWVREEAKRQAFNAIIQGTAAEVMKIGQARLHAYRESTTGLGSVVQRLWIHDECDFTLQDDPALIDWLENACKLIFTNVAPKHDFPVELAIECGTAESWGDA